MKLRDISTILNPYIAATFLLISMLSGSFASASTCFDPTIPRGKSHSILGLTTKIAEPYFYFRSFDYDLTIFVSPSSFRSELESAATNGNKDAHALLGLVTMDLPLTQSTDLFHYIFLNYYHFSLIQNILVDLIARRDASVFDAETGELVPTIEIKRENSERSRGRTFIGPNKKVLIQSIDCIEN